MTPHRVLYDFANEAVDDEAAMVESVDIIADHAIEDGKAVAMYAFDRGFDEGEWRPGRESTDDFRSYVRELAEEALDKFYHDLLEAEMTSEGMLLIWRAMVVPSDWSPENLSTRPAGLHWSWDEHFATAHWGAGGGRKLVMRAEIDLADVDWQESAVLSVVGDYTVGEEREIRIRTTACVRITGIGLDGGEIVEIEPMTVPVAVEEPTFAP